MNSPKTVLVTGAAGYIGSHVCKALSEFGYLPVGLDILPRTDTNAPFGPVEYGDIREISDINRLMDKYKPSAICHLAALIKIGDSVKFPFDYFATNLTGTLNVLESARLHKVQNVIFTSSSSVYGDTQASPIKETENLNPTNPYAMSKLLSEHLMQSLSISPNLRSCCLRLFNVAGADPSIDLSHWHQVTGLLIPTLFKFKNRPGFLLNGRDYSTIDGTCLRDYVHVKDVALAHVQALQHLETNKDAPPFAVYNVGNSIGHTVLEVIAEIERINGISIPYDIGPRRPGDVAKIFADITKIKTNLQWEPKHSNLKEIITSSWNSFLKYGQCD